jgi:chorismate synthase
MSSIFGNRIKVSIFGQSHSQAIGVTIDGLPSGEKINEEKLASFLARRAPGRDEFSTARKEPDRPRILSGMVDGVLCGAPFAAIIENTDTRSGDYANIFDVPRPGHADFTANVKYSGAQDVRGGGHFSGRLTAPLCIAGGICAQILENKGITVGTHIYELAGVRDSAFDPVRVTAAELEALRHKSFAVLDDKAGEQMKKKILEAASECDSVGGIVECAAVGLPAGLGDPMADGLENRIASIVFGIPAVKGIEFGAGFEAARMRGSQNNDSFYMDGDTVRTRTNNHGGILGGISSGMPLIFRCAVKPTPSIAKEQNSISLSQKKDAALTIHGRHDPCIVPRSLPVFEAAAAIALLDAYLDK